MRNYENTHIHIYVHICIYISENNVFLPLLFSITNKNLLSAIFYVTRIIKKLSAISSDIKAEFF